MSNVAQLTLPRLFMLAEDCFVCEVYKHDLLSTGTGELRTVVAPVIYSGDQVLRMQLLFPSYARLCGNHRRIFLTLFGSSSAKCEWGYLKTKFFRFFF